VIPEYFAAAVAFTGDSKRVLCMNPLEHRLILWDVASAKPIWSARTGTLYPSGYAFSPDGKLALTCEGTGLGMRMTIWDIVKGKRLRTLGKQSQKLVTLYGTLFF